MWQDSWHYSADKVRTDKLRAGLKDAFKQLRKEGFVARMNFMCCQSCAGAAIAEDLKKKNKDVDSANVVYYHNQDNVHIDKDGEVYLAHQGNTARVVEVLKEKGLTVEWDGSNFSRVLVKA